MPELSAARLAEIRQRWTFDIPFHAAVHHIFADIEDLLTEIDRLRAVERAAGKLADSIEQTNHVDRNYGPTYVLDEDALAELQALRRGEGG